MIARTVAWRRDIFGNHDRPEGSFLMTMRSICALALRRGPGHEISASAELKFGRALAAIFVALSMVGLLACGSSDPSAQQTQRVFTDMSGAKVKVPTEVERVGEEFPAHTVTTVMLGAGEKLAAVPPNVKTLPFLKKVYPEIASVPELFQSDASVNLEELIEAQVDVVFGWGLALDGTPLEKYKKAGIPALAVGFNSYAELGQSVMVAGDVLGGEARQEARAYVDYINKNINLVESRLANLPASERPSVLHISSYPPIDVDGSGSVADLWVEPAGGKNAMGGIIDGRSTIATEQLLRLDPDVIIVQAPGGHDGLVSGSGQATLAELAKLPGWEGLKAVKNRRVILNPQGVYPWERGSPEGALQILFAAKTLHPDRFNDVDMRAEARDFYKNFFDYTTTDAELDLIFQEAR